MEHISKAEPATIAHFLPVAPAFTNYLLLQSPDLR